MNPEDLIRRAPRNNGDNHNNQNNTEIPKTVKNLIKAGVIFLVLFIVGTIFFKSFLFTVSETEQVVVKQFNEVVKIIVDEKDAAFVENISKDGNLKGVKIITGKGLFFKIPFIQTTESFTNRLLTYDTDAREVTTKDKKKLVLTNFAQWKITNPALFIISLKNESTAHTRLDDIIYSKLNEEIGKVNAHTVISDKDYMKDMLSRVAKNTNEHLLTLGMEVKDIRIKKTDLPVANYNNIFTRMKTERQQAAKTYRSEGLEEAQKISSEADKQATILEAKAYEEAETIIGQGDSQALKIYADAYNKDPEFYEFWRTLQTYKITLKDRTKIVIDNNSTFAKYLFGK